MNNHAALGSWTLSLYALIGTAGCWEVDTVLDSEDSIQSPIKSTAIAPATVSPASRTELKSIIVFTSFLFQIVILVSQGRLSGRPHLK